MHQGHCQCESVVVQGFRALHVAAVWGEKRKDGAVVSASRLAAGLPAPWRTPILTFFRLPQSVPIPGAQRGQGKEHIWEVIPGNTNKETRKGEKPLEATQQEGAYCMQLGLRLIGEDFGK